MSSSVSIPGPKPTPAVSTLSTSLMQQEGALLDAITVPADHISTSPFAGTVGIPAKKTLLVLNASSWIGQAHLGAASTAAQEAVRHLHLGMNSPTEGNGRFSPWTTAAGEEGSVKEGGFYVGSQGPPAAEQPHPPSIGSLGASPSVSFLSGPSLVKRGSAIWNPAEGTDMSNGGKLRVVAAYRSVQKIPETLPPGIDKVVQVDLDVPSSIDAAFAKESIDYVYIIPSYAPNRIHQTSEIVQACLRHRRVRYIVLLSLLAPKSPSFSQTSEQEYPIQREFRELERAVAKSGIPHTFVRVGIFHHQLFEIARRSAEWTQENSPGDSDVISLGLPLKTGSVAPVDVRDVALITSHLFSTYPQNPYINRSLDITGPQLLSGTALVGAMSRGLSRPVRFTNTSTVDFANFLTRVGLAGTVRDVEAIVGLWATAGKGDWAFTGTEIGAIVGEKEGKKRRGIPLHQHFEERKEEIVQMLQEKTSSPNSPTRGPSLVRSNSLLAGSVGSHTRRPSIPSPLLGDLSLGGEKRPTTPPATDLPNPSAPTTTWWTPGTVEGKLGVSMSPAEWLKRYGPGALTSPQKATHIPGGDKKDGFYHGFVQSETQDANAELRGVAEDAIKGK